MIVIENITSLTLITGKQYNVQQINSIEYKHSDLRQLSKGPTFALTFQGTFITLMKNCGFTEEEAKAIYANYHELYSHSTEWVQNRLLQACKDGYVELAFGLRLRTPLLGTTILGTPRTPYRAEKEARTAGNALSGQSYGLLNNRAAVAFMKKVHASKFKYDIKPCALIHDAIYLIIRDDVEVLKWVNDNLIEEMKWQELPEIQHPEVKLGANLEVYYPDWAHPIKLANDISENEILNTIQKSIQEQMK